MEHIPSEAGRLKASLRALPYSTSENDTGGNSPPRRFSKTCVKNVFTVLLIFIYLVLTAVAIFLAYQTISDFLDKLSQPVMSVSYKEVDSFSPPGLYENSTKKNIRRAVVILEHWDKLVIESVVLPREDHRGPWPV